MTIRLREVGAADWPLIDKLASDFVQEADHRGLDTVWSAKRRSFDGVRDHAVAETAGEIVGYCSIERAPDEPYDRFRIFLVADWDRRERVLHETLLAHVESLIARRGATRAWMRELTGDTRLLAFVQANGFRASEPYSIGDTQMVNLSKTYPGPER